MTIYILGTPEETAQALDDKSLNLMIKDIAQVLCTVHHDVKWHDSAESESIVPLPSTIKKDLIQWSQWARECVANYTYLADLSRSCWEEQVFYREKGVTPEKMQRLEYIIEWARDHVPDLPSNFNMNEEKYNGPRYKDELRTEFPLVMPKKYLKIYPYKMVNVFKSYKNYYLSKFTKATGGTLYIHAQAAKWTNRPIPDFIINQKLIA